jgi:hypothetical protein
VGGAGASVMKRIAAPMVGGMLSTTILTLLVIPTIYSHWKQREVHPEGEHVPELEFAGSVPPREADFEAVVLTSP